MGMNVPQTQADPRRPLPDPQQESLVQRIRQQIAAHPNLVAVAVAAAGVGVAIVAYRWYQNNNAGSSTTTTGTTDSGTSTGGTGGTTAPTDPNANNAGLIAGLQSTLSTLQNQFSALQSAVATGAASAASGVTGSNGGNGTGSNAPGNNGSPPLVTMTGVLTGQQTGPVVIGNPAPVQSGPTIAQAIAALTGNKSSDSLQSSTTIQGATIAPLSSSIGIGAPISAPSIKSSPQVVYNQPEALPKTITRPGQRGEY